MKFIILLVVVAVSITFERRAGKDYARSMAWLDESGIGGADRKILESIFSQTRAIHTYFATVSTTVIAAFLFLVWG